MTELLYLDDPCLQEFKATVTSTDGEWVVLDRTAFYPGGGGQEADTGVIEGLDVTEIQNVNGIGHRVPDHRFHVGQGVECRLDWERRLDLMRGHTAEHMLFSALSHQLDDLKLVKISITPERKSVIVTGNIDWETITTVQGELNRAISHDLDVETVWVNRSDPVLEGIRAKLNRIQGDRVRIVRIGEFDAAACAGVHVPTTGMIGKVLVTKMTAAKPVGSVEIEFEVGDRAVDRGLDLASIALSTSDAMGSHPEDLFKAVENLRSMAESSRESLRQCSRQILDSLQPEEVSGINLYSGIYHGVDRRIVFAAANRMVRREKTACILICVEDTMMMIMARSDDLNFDCRDLLGRLLEPIGGRSGGKPEFATGGSPSIDGVKEILEGAISLLR